MPVSIRIDGVAELQKKLGLAASNTVLEKPMEIGVELLHRDISFAPPPLQPGQWAQLTTRKQQKAFFYLLNAGLISGSRTGTLQRKWTTRVRRGGTGVQGIVGTNQKYAPWVQSHQFQARMHRGRWRTDQDVIRKNEKRILQLFKRAIDRALGR